MQNIIPNFNIHTKIAEECGEFTQAVAKLDCWGIEGKYRNGTGNLEAVVMEVADVLACIDILAEKYDLDIPALTAARVLEKKALFRKLIQATNDKESVSPYNPLSPPSVYK